MVQKLLLKIVNQYGYYFAFTEICILLSALLFRIDEYNYWPKCINVYLKFVQLKKLSMNTFGLKFRSIQSQISIFSLLPGKREDVQKVSL